MSMTKAELEERVAELEAENATLRAHLEETTAAAEAPATETARPEPQEPSFGLSEGMRADLEAHGRTVSPFTGKTLVGTPDDYREEGAEAPEAAAPESLPDDPTPTPDEE